MSNIRVPGPDQDHPLAELCGSHAAAKDLFRQLVDELLHGLAGRTEESTAVAHHLVALVKSLAVHDYTDLATELDFTPEHVAQVATAATRVGLLGRVEEALRATGGPGDVDH